MNPARDEESFYILVRIHHLYASEDGVGLSDLLLLKPDDGGGCDGWKHGNCNASRSLAVGQHYTDADSIQNILSTVYQAPTALPRLGEHLSEIFANTWNELVSTYDPLENPKVLRRRPNMFIFGTMLMIAGASAARDKSVSQRFARKFRRELVRRGIRFRYLCRSMVYTFHPAMWASLAWWLWVKCIFRLPITVLLVVRNTSTYVYWTYVLLYSVSELVYLVRLIYRAPGTVIRELVFPLFGGGPGSGEFPVALTDVGDVGTRKCVSWTRPIDLDVVGTIHDNTGAATCEIQLSMLATALQEYFNEAGAQFPETAMTTTRFVSKDNLFQLNNRHVITNGLLALPLPMDTDRDPMYTLHKMQECLQEAIGNQTALYIASMWQIDHSLATSFLPSPLVYSGLRLLSKKYPLSVTYVEEHKLDRKRRRLLWGQEVDAIMYWRPPQSNVRKYPCLLTCVRAIQIEKPTRHKYSHFDRNKNTHLIIIIIIILNKNNPCSF